MKLLLCPGYIYSQTDRDEHFITPQQLIRLYKIDCDKHTTTRICNYNQSVESRAREILCCKEDGWILIYPLDSGKYEERIKELGL